MAAMNLKASISERNCPVKALAKIEVMKPGATKGQTSWGLDLLLGLWENMCFCLDH